MPSISTGLPTLSPDAKVNLAITASGALADKGNLPELESQVQHADETDRHEDPDVVPERLFSRHRPPHLTPIVRDHSSIRNPVIQKSPSYTTTQESTTAAVVDRLTLLAPWASARIWVK